MNYVKNKGATRGPCAICEQVGTLSWDHVPPKGGITLQPVEIEAVYTALTGNKRRFEISQNGLKYRTLCSSCNNLLGSKFDPVLNDFTLGVGRYLHTALHLPPVVTYRTQPAALLRAVLGHLLATKREIDESRFDQRLRAFIMDPAMRVPDDIHVFYWVYPYQQTVVVRDIARIDIRQPGNYMGIISVLKYFPIAYLITDLAAYEGLPDLTIYQGLTSDQEVEVPIDLRNVRAIDWPEAIDDHTAIIMTSGTQESVRAVPRRKQRR